MKRLLAILNLMLIMTSAWGQGIPFIRNFTVEDYHANNTNYDIEIDKYGNVFVANFEGLLYYDYAEWRIIHTPGITRITVVYRASDDTIWVGGYNYFGKVVKKANGEIALQRVAGANLFRSEVTEIFEHEGSLQFVADNGVIYQVKDGQVTVRKKVDKELLKIGMLDVLDVEALEKGESDVVKNDTIQVLTLSKDLKAVLMKNSGIHITDGKNHTLYTLTDANGLCSNNIAYAAYDGRGHLWGATSKGIFVVGIPSAFSHYTPHEGLQGTVLSIESLNGSIYAGTDDGLYRQEGHRFVKVSGVAHACWQLVRSGNGLLAASADGIYRVYADGRVRQLTNSNAMALLEDGSHLYSGETNGIFLMQADGQNRQKVCDMDNVKKLVKDKEGTIWAQSLYGTIWYKKAADSSFHHYEGKGKKETILTAVMADGKVTIVSAEDTAPIPYPLLSYVDEQGVTWLTNNEGKQLYRWKGGKRLDDSSRLLLPVKDMVVGSIFTRTGELWLGNDKGLTIVNTRVADLALSNTPKLYIRSMRLGNDSILWTGLGDMPDMAPELNYDENVIRFTFSIDCPFVAGETLYRYRLNDGNWSAWNTNTSASFANLSPGRYTFSVQTLDVLNRVTETTSMQFRIIPPFYIRWYMNIFYLLLMLALAYALFRLRLRRLEKEKVRLETVVRERSAEVVRLEKMATAGKLTQGLIDRILNPLNYINNFAKLSEGLVRDVKANVVEEKEHIDKNNYEDTVEVLDMITGNLQKVGEHGQNTTRILKAMEEMLKDRSGGVVDMDLMAVIRQDKEILHEYYKQEIAQYGIRTYFNDSNEQLPISGNPDQLSKTIMSVLGNAVYAVARKAQKLHNGEAVEAYVPEITLYVERKNKTIKLSVRDNGIGIEEGIIGKIFDPFFTTKTTAEASGVELYLSREIVQSHGGDIQVNSLKNEYTEFIITLPVRKS